MDLIKQALLNTIDKDIKRRQNMTENDKLREEIEELRSIIKNMSKEIADLKKQMHNENSCKCDTCKHYEMRPAYVPPTEEELRQREIEEYRKWKETRRIQHNYDDIDQQW